MSRRTGLVAFDSDCMRERFAVTLMPLRISLTRPKIGTHNAQEREFRRARDGHAATREQYCPHRAGLAEEAACGRLSLKLAIFR